LSCGYENTKGDFLCKITGVAEWTWKHQASLKEFTSFSVTRFKQLLQTNVPVEQLVLDKSRIKVSLNSSSHCSVSNCQDTDVCQCNISVWENVIEYWYIFDRYFVGTQFKTDFWIQFIFNYTCSGVLSKIRFSCSFRLLSWSASNTYILVSWLELAFNCKGYNYCWSCVCTNSFFGWRIRQKMSAGCNTDGIFAPLLSLHLKFVTTVMKNAKDMCILNVPFHVLRNPHCKIYLYFSNPCTINHNWYLVSASTSSTGTFTIVHAWVLWLEY